MIHDATISWIRADVDIGRGLTYDVPSWARLGDTAEVPIVHPVYGREIQKAPITSMPSESGYDGPVRRAFGIWRLCPECGELRKVDGPYE